MLRRLLGLPRLGGPDDVTVAGTSGGAATAGMGGQEQGGHDVPPPTQPTLRPVDAAPAAGDPGTAGGWTGGSATETATVREIVARLDSMPHDEARFLAGFAYILSRIADADLHVTDDETREMESIVMEHGHISEPQAVIVVQIAKTRADLFGPTEDFLVTREFRRIATDDQCLDLLRCCFIVGAADGTITAEESGSLSSIADELGVDAEGLRRLRAEFAGQSAALQAMRRARGA